MNIDKEEFITQSMKPDEYGDDNKLFLKSKPCQFLKDKKCTIFDLRPEECNSYPYIHKEDFISRLHGVISNYEICPIVYNVYELLSKGWILSKDKMSYFYNDEFENSWLQVSNIEVSG